LYAIPMNPAPCTFRTRVVPSAIRVFTLPLPSEERTNVKGVKDVHVKAKARLSFVCHMFSTAAPKPQTPNNNP